MADIFEEVEEGLRQDRLTILWKKYGIFAYIAAFLLIGGVALNEYLQHRTAVSTETNAGRLETAIVSAEAREYQDADQELMALVNEDLSLSGAAAHYLAGVKLDGFGDAEAAAALLIEAAADAESPTERLALIKAAYLRADSMTRLELEALLAPLTEADDAFSALATELIAAKALEEGDIEYARRQFSFLRLAQNVPPGVMTRATQALAGLPPAQSAEETEETAPTDDAASDPENETAEAPAEPSVEAEETTQ